MKILIATILLGAVGAGSLRLSATEVPSDSAAAASGCNATVTCTPEGNCRITCDGPNGPCSIEIACDGGECRIVDCDGPGCCAEACAPGETVQLASQLPEGSASAHPAGATSVLASPASAVAAPSGSTPESSAPAKTAPASCAPRCGDAAPACKSDC